VSSSRLGALLAVATFAGTVGYGFVYDDRPVVQMNPAADDPADWRAILLAPCCVWRRACAPRASAWRGSQPAIR